MSRPWPPQYAALHNARLATGKYLEQAFGALPGAHLGIAATMMLRGHDTGMNGRETTMKAVRDLPVRAAPTDSPARPPFGAYAPDRTQKALIGLARATFLHRGFFRPLMTRLILGARNGALDIEAAGHRWRIGGGNNLIEQGLLLHPAYNRTDIEFLTQGARAGDIFIDIGANIGLYTLPLAKAVGPGGLVIAIDANPAMIGQLAFNAAASNLENVALFDCAVSDRETRGTLTIRNEDVAIVALNEDARGAVRVRTLASILAECNVESIRGLKIDIEGHEDRALVPFLGSAPESLLPSRIVIETASPGQDYPGCANIFARRGYVLAGRTKNNSLYALNGIPT